MNQSNSHTPSDTSDSQSESAPPAVRLIHMSTRSLLLGKIVGASKELIVLEDLFEVMCTYDENGFIRSYALVPYLDQFIEPGYRRGINLEHVVSINNPATQLLKAYTDSIISSNDRAVADHDVKLTPSEETDVASPSMFVKPTKNSLH